MNKRFMLARAAIEHNRAGLRTNVHTASLKPAFGWVHHDRRVLLLRVGKEEVRWADVHAEIAAHADSRIDRHGIDKRLLGNKV